MVSVYTPMGGGWGQQQETRHAMDHGQAAGGRGGLALRSFLPEAGVEILGETGKGGYVPPILAVLISDNDSDYEEVTTTGSVFAHPIAHSIGHPI